MDHLNTLAVVVVEPRCNHLAGSAAPCKDQDDAVGYVEPVGNTLGFLVSVVVVSSRYGITSLVLETELGSCILVAAAPSLCKCCSPERCCCCFLASNQPEEVVDSSSSVAAAAEEDFEGMLE